MYGEDQGWSEFLEGVNLVLEIAFTNDVGRS